MLVPYALCALRPEELREAMLLADKSVACKNRLPALPELVDSTCVQGAETMHPTLQSQPHCGGGGALDHSGFETTAVIS